MRIEKLAKKLDVSKKEIDQQCIKCDRCGEVATVIVADEFSSQVDHYCKKCQEKQLFGGASITDYKFKVLGPFNGRPLIKTEKVLQ